MPFIIRIISQRIVIFVFSFLAFLGINPDIHVPNSEEIAKIEEKQNSVIDNIMQEDSQIEDESPKIEEVKNKIEDIFNKVEEKNSKIQETIQDIINVPEIEKGENTLIEPKGNFLENVIVNIVCINKGETVIKMTTGSGVIVSSSGIVLTNTHVANNFLFDNKKSDSYKECSIRRENIPTYGFNAKLVYLSEDWLRENQSFFETDNPKGDGESDYALLAITSNTNPVLSIPDSFEYANIITDYSDIEKGKNIKVAAYPGMHTGVFEIDSNGKLKEDTTFISDLMTFGSNSADVISTGPNNVAQKGSSGGGLFSGENLLGIVVTTDTNSDGNYINAITLPYIYKDFSNETGENFKNYISKNKNTLISNYSDDIQELKEIIADFL